MAKFQKAPVPKVPWSSAEDGTLLKIVGDGALNVEWTKIAKLLNNRTGKQCRERYKNHLQPGLNKSPFTKEEDDIINNEQKRYGKNKWAAIAKMLPGRSDNAVKNRWHIMNRRNIALRGAIADPLQNILSSYAMDWKVEECSESHDENVNLNFTFEELKEAGFSDDEDVKRFDFVDCGSDILIFKENDQLTASLLSSFDYYDTSTSSTFGSTQSSPTNSVTTFESTQSSTTNSETTFESTQSSPTNSVMSSLSITTDCFSGGRYGGLKQQQRSPHVPISPDYHKKQHRP